MIVIKRFSVADKEIATAAFDIRRKVFVEEQLVDPSDEFDEFEKISSHYIAFYNNFPAGTARWRVTENGIKLERFAVLASFRNKSIGKRILDKVLNDITLEANVYLHAQISAVKFYERAGFVKKGDVFTECNIEHYLMEWERNKV